MKRGIAWLLALLLCAAPAFASAQADAEEAQITACLRQAHPQGEIADVQRWGDTAAAVLTDQGTQVLCVAEKQGGQWALVVDNPTALLQGEPLPSLLLDTDTALFWSYDDGSAEMTFNAWRNVEGVWGPVSQTERRQLNEQEIAEQQVSWSVDGQITRVSRVCDPNDNVLYGSESSESFPAPWLSACIDLADFDVSRFPLAMTDQEYEGQWPEKAFIQEAAAYLMPGYTFVGGSLANGYLQFLMDKPDGSRVFVGCTYEGEIRLYESTPLPAQTYYGVENFTNSLGMNGQGVTLSFYPDLSQWGVSQILEAGIQLGPRCVFNDWDPQTMCFGDHPWSNIASIDWGTLPHSFEEAADVVGGGSWAIVANPDPADRLHLRQSPDRSSASLGKYYNGTPVQVLEESGEWVRVQVGGTDGWMMRAFLSFQQPYVVSLSAMPRMQLREQTAELYETFSLSSSSRLLSEGDTARMYTIGILEDDWYHVWFPLTDEYGYIPQQQLWEGNG